MTHLVIVKLGGSILTEKHYRRPVVRKRLIRKIASALKRVRISHPNFSFILLYGGGSFGHPLAQRYRLMNASLTRRALVGFGHTTIAMRELGNRLTRILLAVGLPVVPLQTSTFVEQRGSRLHFASFAVIETILRHRGIPLLGGDIVIADRTRIVVASADALAVALVAHFPNSKLLFATDVAGVYAIFPPPRGGQPLAHISRRELAVLTQPATTTTKRDVTGGMIGKLKALSALRGVSVVIFNGRIVKNFGAAIAGKEIGTVIRL